ncbi:Glutamate synthase [NADPH] putative GlxC chain [Rhodopirellula islandica]|uniref:Glutamate synthase [NADPH] putative GlxC chain n=1 Tax=Rhodopirellula islandica TaxID=595434 RepID=A0A0J1BFM9_RHOIS|nr:Glutamate synthase [NADPH] putative GlxC chain [Rhodopirellula islandica]
MERDVTKEPHQPDHSWDISNLSDAELRSAMQSIPCQTDPEAPAPLVELTGLHGQHSAMMRCETPLRFQAAGDLGDYAFAFCRDADVRLDGNVGHGAGDGMRRGVVLITGNAGCGLGSAMTGGTLAVYGSAGDRVGAAMRGGSIFVRGSVGDDTGAGALGGTIVVGGDAGKRLGDGLNNVTVFLRGKAESLAPGVIEAPLRKREEVRLGLLLMGASIRGSASEFRRIIPQARLDAEEAGAGEIRPNWR